jgi:hypothetical protein
MRSRRLFLFAILTLSLLPVQFSRTAAATLKANTVYLFVARDSKSKGGILNAVTVLRRDPREGNRWKIIFITVPA